MTQAAIKPARIAAQVAANGLTYYLTKLQLNPHETRAIDLRKLRDAQQPDFKCNKVPAATDGSVIWLRIDNLPVIGRLMVIHRHEGMASNYDCNNCICPASYVPWLNYMNPASASLLVQGTANLTFYAAFEGCNGSPYYYNETGSASWSSQPPGIVSVNSGTVTGQSGGTTSVTGQYTGTKYTMDPIMFYCVPSPLCGGGSGTENVVPHITSISPSGGLIGATTSVSISGSGFGASPTVSAGTGITVTRNSFNDTQIQASFAVASNAPSGNHSVTVTTAQGTSNSDKNFYVQVPGTFNGLSVTATDLGCAAGTAGIGAKVQYQVLDQASSAINVAGLTPQEHFTVNGTPAFPGFLPFATPQDTDAAGKFLDIPVGTCFGPPVPTSNLCVDVVQTFNIMVGTVAFPISTTTTRRECVQGIRVQVSPGSTTTIGTVN